MTNENHLVRDLIDLMESPAIKIQCQATLALRNLASDEYFQLEITRNNLALSRLLKLLDIASLKAGGADTQPAVDRSQLQLVLAAVACIRNISIHPNNENKIIDAGFLKPLVGLLDPSADGSNEEIQCHSISTLRNLAAGTGIASEHETDQEDVDNKEKLVDSGALIKIQNLIDASVRHHAQSGQWNLSWPVLSEMTACLAVLALSDRLKPKLLSSNIVKTLVPLTFPSIPSEVQGNAAAALGNLSTKATTLDPFLAEWDSVCAYLERFLEPIPTSNNTTHYHEMDEAAGTFQHIAVWTLLQFCEKDERVCHKIREHGHLVKLVENVNGYSVDEEVRSLSSRVLSLLGISPSNQAAAK
jgi:vacuolar protein 8